MDMELTHFDAAGRARMVDVTAKPDTDREAIAKGEVVMRPDTLALIKENRIAKGDVLAVAQVAGIMAAKRTADLIPMCHPLGLTSVDLNFEMVRLELHSEVTVGAPRPGRRPTPDGGEARILITATAKSTGKTGVEMEALTAVTVAGLTIYDMCKAVDRAMRLEHIRLVRKSGGKSGLIVLEDTA
jgi:cyclic pyranopterin monophosphate synthase